MELFLDVLGESQMCIRDSPIGGWGNDDTVQNLISSFNAKYSTVTLITPTATIR